jgi:hypothetical protein
MNRGAGLGVKGNSFRSHFNAPVPESVSPRSHEAHEAVVPAVN